MNNFLTLIGLLSSIPRASCFFESPNAMFYGKGVSKHPDLEISTFAINFQIEGYGSELFTSKLDGTMGTFQGDLQRKLNKVSNTRGTYNYTKVQTGEIDQYIAVLAVNCVPVEMDCSAEKTEDNCQMIECTADITHDKNTDPALVEYGFLAMSEGFFKFTKPNEKDDFTGLSYKGPYGVNTTTAIQLVGVPAAPMSVNDTAHFLSSVAEFVDAMDDTLQYNVTVRSMNLSTQNIHRGGTIEGQHVLLTEVHFLSVHSSVPPKPSFEKVVNEYLENNGDYLVEGLRARGVDGVEVEYFKDVTQARNALSLTEIEEINEIENLIRTKALTPDAELAGEGEAQGKKKVSEGLSLVLAMFGVLMAAILPVAAYTVSKHRREGSFRRRIRLVRADLDDDCNENGTMASF